MNDLIKTAKELIAKAERATSIPSDSEGNFYRPAFTSGRDEGVKVIEGKLIHVPMSKFDYDFYCSAQSNITALCKLLLEYHDELDCALKYLKYMDTWGSLEEYEPEYQMRESFRRALEAGRKGDRCKHDIHGEDCRECFP